MDTRMAHSIANALIAVHREYDVSLENLFGVQSPEVQTAGLLEMAEWRDPDTIEMFLKFGADVNGKDMGGFSVLENVLQGHDGYWMTSNWNPVVLDILAKYNVNRTAVRDWIIEERCAQAPQYVRDFLGV